MEEILKAIARGIFVHQSINIGSKIVNGKSVTKSDEQGFWLSLLFIGLAHLPAHNQQPINTTVRQ